MKLVMRLAAGKAMAAVAPPVAEVLPAPRGRPWRPFARRERNRGVLPEKPAVLALLLGHKDLASPWEEVPDFYQSFPDSWIKHEQIAEQFAPPWIADAHPQLDEREIAPHFEGEPAVANPSLTEDDRSRILNGISSTVPHDRQISVILQAARGNSGLVALLAGLMGPSGGCWPMSSAGARRSLRDDLGAPRRERRPQLRRYARLE
jgi:hypothetical protein